MTLTLILNVPPVEQVRGIEDLCFSNQFDAPKVMEVEDAFDMAFAVDYCQRSNFLFFQQGQGAGG